MSIEPDAAQIRVLGSLLEKQRTTPDAYPLSVNALRLACNQSTNRDPVLDLDERTVLDALEELSRRRWVRLTSGAGSRARKYRQLLGEALSLSEPDLAVLCVLMLRGPQTPGELKQRTERLHPFTDLAAIHDTLDSLIDRGHAERLGRRPGQKEERYRQLIGGDEEEAQAAPATPIAAPAPAEASPPPVAAPAPPTGVTDDGRLATLEAEVAALRRELNAIKEELGA